MKPAYLLLPALTGLLAQCKKADADPQLPPATQSGANTFGCRVNGQVWLPKGNTGGPNSVALYDPGLNTPGGAGLNIATYRIDGSREYINLFCGPITAQKRVFNMSLPVAEASGFYNGPYGYYFTSQALIYLRGQVVLTLLDERAGVVAGTFWFKSLRAGSPDTLRVTDGRFDYKF